MKRRGTWTTYREEDRDNMNDASKADRFSQMPDHLIHRILSFLNAGEAARASILSKSWNDIWSTSPNLKFDLHYGAEKYYIHKANQEQLWNLVDESVHRPIQQNLNLSKLILRVCFPSVEFLAPRIDRWVCTAIERNVHKLKLNIAFSWNNPYGVPEMVMSSKSLAVLMLSHCKLKGKCDKLPRLRKLCLSDCMLNDEMFQNILSNCSSLENLKVSNCHSLKSLRLVPSLHKLKDVCLQLPDSHECTIEVEASNILSFELMGFPDKSSSINFAVSVAIKKFKLSNASITREQFQNLMSQLPSLEVLELRGVYNLTGIKLSNHKLKKLVLSDCFPAINIDAPNLVSVFHN